MKTAAHSRGPRFAGTAPGCRGSLDAGETLSGFRGRGAPQRRIPICAGRRSSSAGWLRAQAPRTSGNTLRAAGARQTHAALGQGAQGSHRRCGRAGSGAPHCGDASAQRLPPDADSGAFGTTMRLRRRRHEPIPGSASRLKRRRTCCVCSISCLNRTSPQATSARGDRQGNRAVGSVPLLPAARPWAATATRSCELIIPSRLRLRRAVSRSRTVNRHCSRRAHQREADYH